MKTVNTKPTLAPKEQNPIPFGLVLSPVRDVVISEVDSMRQDYDPIANNAKFPVPTEELEFVKLQIAQHAVYQPSDACTTYEKSVAEITPILGRAVWELCDSELAWYGIADDIVCVYAGRKLAEWYTDQKERANETNGADTWLELCQHSDDFASVNWFGDKFTFTTSQRSVVQALWEAKKAGTPVVADETLIERAGSDADSLRDLFHSNSKNHPAWNKLIVKIGRDSRRLPEGKISKKI